MYEIIKIEGFCVLLNHLSNTKTCKVEAMIGGGFINETKSNSGIAHFTEHVISESWKNCFKKGCARFWSKYGAHYNAETGDNYVSYYIEGFINDINLMLDYICKIIVEPDIPNGRLKKEKNAVINELSRSTQVEVDLYDKSNELVFKNEGLRYYSDRKLQIKNLKKFNKHSVENWIHQNYCQDNIIFIISGNFEKKLIIKKMKTIFKKKKMNIFSPPEPLNLFNTGKAIAFVPAPRKKNMSIQLLFPYKFDKPNLNIIYTSFFQMFVNGSIQSIIMYELREKLELIYTSNVDIDVYTSSALMTITLSSKSGKFEVVLKEAKRVLKKISTGDFSDESLENLKKQFIINHYIMHKSNDFYTRFYGTQLMNKLDSLNKNTKIYTPEEVVSFIKNISKKDFVKFINHVLNFDNLKIVYQAPKK